nr:B12-binding domain-containing radical SAM protein [Spirochaetota bacterium]
MLKTIEDNLSKFQKPGRYIGSETGIPQKDFKNSPTRFVMSYPDLYEVGMSNNGLRIIYDIINKLDFASCERVFAPWSDFEEFLRINKIPLYSLESYTPLNEFDFLGFTIQYELLFTNMLNIMELGKIDCLRENRGDNTPIIIAGGPSAVNPSPFSPFVDIFFIGEAEGRLENFLKIYNELKNKKTKKDDIIRELSKIDGFYSPKYSKSVKRQIYSGFSLDCGIDTYISPIIDVVQNKVVVEITRGCPNKCRFCQAGIIYKPYREKDLDVIFNNIDKG